MFSVDWLQVHCIGELANSANFVFNDESFQTRHFKRVSNVFYKNNLYFSVVSLPHSRILNPLSVIIKVLNHQLYSCDYLNVLYLFINEQNLTFNNITRIDLCYDFNLFSNNLSVNDFFEKLVSCKFLYNGRSKFHLIGTQKLLNIYECLKYGSNTSDVAVYLYNKTQEMSEVKFKTYIFEMWQKRDLNLLSDVWRLEFSIKNTNKNIINKLSGEFFNISDSFFVLESILFDCFICCLNAYFDIRINNFTKNKSRMSKVVLFDFSCSDFLIKDSVSDSVSSRADKIFIKKLENLNIELRNDSVQFRSSINEIINDIVPKKGLVDFYYRKVKRY